MALSLVRACSPSRFSIVRVLMSLGSLLPAASNILRCAISGTDVSNVLGFSAYALRKRSIALSAAAIVSSVSTLSLISVGVSFFPSSS